MTVRSPVCLFVSSISKVLFMYTHVEKTDSKRMHAHTDISDTFQFCGDIDSMYKQVYIAMPCDFR